MDEEPIIREPERTYCQIASQLLKVFSTRGISLSVIAPRVRICSHLTGDPLHHMSWHLPVIAERISRKPQHTELDGEAEPVGLASTLTDQGQIGVVERIVLNQLVL